MSYVHPSKFNARTQAAPGDVYQIGAGHELHHDASAADVRAVQADSGLQTVSGCVSETDAAKRSSPTADLPGPTFASDETSPGTVVPKQRFRPAALIGAVETTSRERQSP